MTRKVKAPWVETSLRAKLAYRRMPPRLVRWGFHPSPLGPLLIGVNEQSGLCLIQFAEGSSEKKTLAVWQKKWRKTEFVQDVKVTEAIIKAMFSSPKTLDMVATGTVFQQKIWQQMLHIKAGDVISYAKMARRIHNPRAARAVGNACGANPLPILIPCHRVIASDGTFGGFGGGLPLKKKMLAAEVGKLSSS